MIIYVLYVRKIRRFVMKRIFRNTTAMALMLVMLLIPSIVLADKEYVGDSSECADTPYVTYQKSEITDIDILYARALSGNCICYSAGHRDSGR